MSIDLRVKHDLESRRRAVELFDAGVGCKPAAEALSVPRETVREWQWVYRAFGSEALLSMGGKQSRYTFEQRVAAASAVVDGGMAKADAMAEFGIRSKSPLERWCRLYREGGGRGAAARPTGEAEGSRSNPGPHPRAGGRGA
ncbi:helix-turn-helix domain-containing protein, partial [Collinsella sp. 4_8_47FAA]|uniref:helix-turn-helix domain-containing protein n=1 Tax=Collinsella sp. 4_8_47FAA TaxID=742722 RepID=UPI00050E2515